MKRWSQDEDPHGVQKLLAMLRTQQDSGTGSKVSATPANSAAAAAAAASVYSPARTTHQETKAEDVRFISFAQALPHLTRLSEDEVFLAALLRLKNEQDRYEKRLAVERAQFSDHKGSGPSSEAALASWDREALRRWDTLYQEQQKRLQSLGVPCFFETQEASHLKKQQRVFDVLSALLE